MKFPSLELLAVGLFVAGLGFGAALSGPSHRITAAIVVASPCGIYNLMTVDDAGEVTQYPDAPPSTEILELVNALPDDKRIIELAPCPQAQLTPQYEAQSQDRPYIEALARQAEGDVFYRYRAGANSR